MLAAGDWVIYAIPIIAFLVWLLSNLLRSSQPPAPSRPSRPRGSEPVVFPERSAERPSREIPVVQPVETPTARRDRLQEFLERRRRERSGAPAKGQRRPPRTPPAVIVAEPPPPVAPPRPSAPEVVVVLPSSAIVQEPPARPVTPSPRPQKELVREAPEFQGPPPPGQPLPQQPAPALLKLGRFLAQRDELQAAFLLRELLGPPKALHWLARGQPPTHAITPPAHQSL
ncbi:hypothetical protein HRbin36_00271 [bacterium HR36]|nr:hypothetical protein HRbin36_00271 [bacterium HR36]